MKEEITKQDSVLDTISSVSVIGDRVIVLLDEAKEHSTTDSGFIIPLNNIVEKPSGQQGTELSSRSHLDKGTVVAISEFASAKLSEQQASVKVGDRVFVSPLVGRNVKSYQFLLNRDRLVTDFEGLVCVPYTFIEAKIN